MASPVKPSDFRDVISDPNATMCENFTKTLLRLPVLIYQFMNWFLTSDGELSDAVKADVIEVACPIGTMLMFGGGSAPDGFLMCNGAAVSRSTYAALFAVIGTTFGPGDTTTTFNLPDMQDRVPRGPGSVGATGGADSVTLLEANLPAHTHGVPAEDPPGGGGSGTFYVQSEEDNAGQADRDIETTSVGSGTAVDIIPSHLVVNFIIKF